jgi:hypothetical protein
MSFPIIGPNPGAATESGIQGADFTDSRNATGEDAFSHAPGGRICKTCDRPIEDRQAARRRGAEDWVHDVCPVVTD